VSLPTPEGPESTISRGWFCPVFKVTLLSTITSPKVYSGLETTHPRMFYPMTVCLALIIISKPDLDA